MVESSDAQDDEGSVEAGGYRQELKRTLGSFQVFAISFAFISVAVGIFATFDEVLQTAGPVGIWLWIVAAVGQTLVALVVAQFAARIPLSGSSYQWASRLASPKIGWWFGWLTFCYLAIGDGQHGSDSEVYDPAVGILAQASGGIRCARRGRRHRRQGRLLGQHRRTHLRLRHRPDRTAPARQPVQRRRGQPARRGRYRQHPIHRRQRPVRPVRTGHELDCGLTPPDRARRAPPAPAAVTGPSSTTAPPLPAGRRAPAAPRARAALPLPTPPCPSPTAPARAVPEATAARAATEAAEHAAATTNTCPRTSARTARTDSPAPPAATAATDTYSSAGTPRPPDAPAGRGLPARGGHAGRHSSTLLSRSTFTGRKPRSGAHGVPVVLAEKTTLSGCTPVTMLGNWCGSLSEGVDAVLVLAPGLVPCRQDRGAQYAVETLAAAEERAVDRGTARTRIV